MLEGEGADQASGSSNFDSKGEVPGLEPLMHKIIKDGKKPAREREAPKAGAKDQP